jgi:pantoate--beta-alanine ligase
MKRAAQERIGRLVVARTVLDLRRRVRLWRRAGETVALVPTMGALHAGHLALVTRGKELCDRVVVSLFVNPMQFAPSEDFSRYPRDERGDAAKLAEARVDLLYAPGLAEIYPEGFSTTVSAGALADGLCGPFRPGHFAGVATVVTKLLLQAQADVACFGEKDWQQLQIVRRLVRDLDIPMRIEGVPIVRESDGLALSSRNVYLSPAERQAAPALHRTLLAIVQRIETGKTSPRRARRGSRSSSARASARSTMSPRWMRSRWRRCARIARAAFLRRPGSAAPASSTTCRSGRCAWMSAHSERAIRNHTL